MPHSNEIKLKKALKPTQVMNKSYKTLATEGEWKKLLGEPEITGSWIIYGDSGHGKTTFVLQLAKYLCAFKKVAYNPLEEGTSKTLSDALTNANLKSKNFCILQKESYQELIARIESKRSPDIYIIDSVQYFVMSENDYNTITTKEFKKLVDSYPNKLFIFISHIEGKYPRGECAKSIRYHSSVKIKIEDYKAYSISRGIKGSTYNIEQKWES